MLLSDAQRVIARHKHIADRYRALVKSQKPAKGKRSSTQFELELDFSEEE